MTNPQLPHPVRERIASDMAVWGTSLIWAEDYTEAEKDVWRARADLVLPRWVLCSDQEFPTERGLYAVRLPGDSEALEGHTIYDFTDWTEEAHWLPDPIAITGTKMFQDCEGTIPVTDFEQSVGLVVYDTDEPVPGSAQFTEVALVEDTGENGGMWYMQNAEPDGMIAWCGPLLCPEYDGPGS